MQAPNFGGRFDQLSRWIFYAVFTHVLFTPSLGRARRPCRGLEKFFPPVLQRCYGCSFDSQEIVHTGHGMLVFFFFFFFLERKCLPKVSWKSNPAAPGLANQMPLYIFYTMMQKSKKWPKSQIKGENCLQGPKNTQSQTSVNHFFQTFSCPSPQESTGQNAQTVIANITSIVIFFFTPLAPSCQRSP